MFSRVARRHFDSDRNDPDRSWTSSSCNWVLDWCQHRSSCRARNHLRTCWHIRCCRSRKWRISDCRGRASSHPHFRCNRIWIVWTDYRGFPPRSACTRPRTILRRHSAGRSGGCSYPERSTGWAGPVRSNNVGNSRRKIRLETLPRIFGSRSYWLRRYRFSVRGWDKPLQNKTKMTVYGTVCGNVHAMTVRIKLGQSNCKWWCEWRQTY